VEEGRMYTLQDYNSQDVTTNSGVLPDRGHLKPFTKLINKTDTGHLDRNKRSIGPLLMQTGLKTVAARGISLLPSLAPMAIPFLGPLAPAAIGILSIFAVIFSIAHLIQIATGTGSQDDIKMAINELTIEEQMHKTGINILTDNLLFLFKNTKNLQFDALEARVEAATQFYEQEFERIFSGLETLHLQRLSPKLVAAKEIRESLDSMEILLKAEGLRLVNDRPDSLFKTETSHLFFNNGTMRIIVHLPCYRDGGILSLFRHIPLPISLTNSSLMAISTEHTYLAVDSTGSLFKTFDTDTFQNCKRLNELWTCPNFNIYDRRTQDNCLVSLYHSRPQLISRNCNMKIFPPNDFITQINATTFIVLLSQPQQVERICPKIKSRGLSDFFSYTGLVKIHLSPGCKAISNSFMFEADENVFGDPIDITLRIMNVTALLSEFQLPHIINPIALDKITERPALTPTFPIDSNNTDHSFIYLATGCIASVILLIILILGLNLRRKCNRNRSPRERYILVPKRGQRHNPSIATPEESTHTELRSLNDQV
jgi:hypothetical protein